MLTIPSFCMWCALNWGEFRFPGHVHVKVEGRSTVGKVIDETYKSEPKKRINHKGSANQKANSFF